VGMPLLIGAGDEEVVEVEADDLRQVVEPLETDAFARDEHWRDDGRGWRSSQASAPTATGGQPRKDWPFLRLHPPRAVQDTPCVCLGCPRPQLMRSPTRTLTGSRTTSRSPCPRPWAGSCSPAPFSRA